MHVQVRPLFGKFDTLFLSLKFFTVLKTVVIGKPSPLEILLYVVPLLYKPIISPRSASVKI